ncbi:hypothetical protein KAW38_03450 [Candidatus Micrarchaeota archaeon]|nr:hypothetical protein [Candidatus Micrarchaeota archaeon]
MARETKVKESKKPGLIPIRKNARLAQVPKKKGRIMATMRIKSGKVYLEKGYSVKNIKNKKLLLEASRLFVKKWSEWKKVSNRILETAEALMKETKDKGWENGVWDCALFTREVYNRVISELLSESFKEASKGKSSAKIDVDIGECTYLQWTNTKKMTKSLKQNKLLDLLEKEPEKYKGMLVFHKSTNRKFANPSRRGTYGHVAIYSGVENEIPMGYDNTISFYGDGVRKRPIDSMFRTSRIDRGSEPFLFISRPDFSNASIVVRTSSVSLETKVWSRHKIRVNIAIKNK